MTETASFLLVTAGGRLVGLPVESLVAVADFPPPHRVPSSEPALRGVATVRGELMPVVHLGAFLDGGTCPPSVGDAGVVIEVNGVRLCLEVDEADVVVRDAVLPLPPGSALPWARAVARRSGRLVPLLDLSALGARLSEAGIDT